MADILYGTPLGVRENLVDMKDGSHVKCVNVISPIDVDVATIESGESLSDAIDLKNLRLFGIITPAALTGTVFTFQESVDGGTTWLNLYDEYGTEVSVSVGTSRSITLDPVKFAAVSMLRIRSGPAASPTNEAADRTIRLKLRSI